MAWALQASAARKVRGVISVASVVRPNPALDKDDVIARHIAAISIVKGTNDYSKGALINIHEHD